MIRWLRLRWYNDWSLQLADARLAWDARLGSRRLWNALRGRGVRVEARTVLLHPTDTRFAEGILDRDAYMVSVPLLDALRADAFASRAAALSELRREP